MKKLNMNLIYLLAGQLISQLGDKFYGLALAFWILDTTKSPALMGTVLFFSLAPAIIVGFFSGGFIDNLNRKKILIITDILRGIIITLVTVSYYFKIMNIYVLIVSQILLSICSAFFNPTVTAVLVQVVKQDELSRANSRSQLITALTTIVGPVLGGMSVAYMGYTFVFVFNAVSFLLAALFNGFIKFPYNKIEKFAGSKVIKDIVIGYKYIFKKKKLIVLLAIVAVIHFFVGSIQVLIPIVATSLNGNGPKNLGMIEMFFGIGALIASLFLSVFSINKKEQKIMFSGIFVIGFLVLIFGLIVGINVKVLAPFLVLFMLFSSVIIVVSTCFQVLIQKNVENNMIGRVFGVVSSIGNLSIPVAAIIYGYLFEYAKMEYVVSITGLFIIILISIFYPIYTSLKEDKEGKLQVEEKEVDVSILEER